MRQDNPDFTVHMRVIRKIREAPLAKAVTKKGTGSGPSYEPPPEQLHELQR